jgi:hypothetical protein
MAERANPFDVSDLVEPAKPAQPTEQRVAPEKAPDRPSRTQIDQLARDTGFISRERPRLGRRLKTGRNRQLNLKVRDEDLERLYRIADREQITLGEVFERALDALERMPRT